MIFLRNAQKMTGLVVVELSVLCFVIVDISQELAVETVMKICCTL